MVGVSIALIVIIVIQNDLYNSISKKKNLFYRFFFICVGVWWLFFVKLMVNKFLLVWGGVVGAVLRHINFAGDTITGRWGGG